MPLFSIKIELNRKESNIPLIELAWVLFFVKISTSQYYAINVSALVASSWISGSMNAEILILAIIKISAFIDPEIQQSRPTAHVRPATIYRT